MLAAIRYIHTVCVVIIFVTRLYILLQSPSHFDMVVFNSFPPIAKRGDQKFTDGMRFSTFSEVEVLP